MKKVVNILLTIFGIGILLCLLAGALALPGYLVAMCIGGETASRLAEWILKQYMPWVIRAASVFAGIGLIAMYLNRQKALTGGAKDKK